MGTGDEADEWDDLGPKTPSYQRKAWSFPKIPCGHGDQNQNRLSPSEPPNPTTKIGSQMGGAPIPKWYHWS